MAVLFPGKTYSQINAQWYASNQEAIDSLRKGDFMVQVLDEGGNPSSAIVSYELVKHEFPWGTEITVYNTEDDFWYKAVARKYFNNGVAGNDFKWSFVERTQGVVDYSGFQRQLAFTNSAGWDMRGHCLLWGSSSYEDFHPLMQWVKDLPDSLMYEACKTRVTRDMDYWKGTIKEYDVLNEATPGHADWLQQQVGDSINWNCFKWARETDPDAKLYLNEYNVITGWDYKNFISLVHTMLENGAPIDGLGVQGHFGASVDPFEVSMILDTLATFGLEIKVTEFDMSVGALNVTEEDQAKHYALAMRTCFAHPGVDGFLFWGFWDNRIWKDKAGLYRVDKSPKPAADSVYNLIHKLWSSSENDLEIPGTGQNVNVYYGTYRFRVNINGEIREFEVDLSRAEEGNPVILNFADGTDCTPELIAAVGIDSDKIRLRFDRKMSSTALAKNEFRVFTSQINYVNAVSQPVDDSSIILLQTGSSILDAENLTVSYFPGTVKSAEGIALPFFGLFPVTTSFPTLVSAFTNVTGDTVFLNFSVPMNDPPESSYSNFSLLADGVTVNVTGIGKISENQYFILPATKFKKGQVLRVSYSNGEITATDGGYLQEITNRNVNNFVITGIHSLADRNLLNGFFDKPAEQLVLRNNYGNGETFSFRIYNMTGSLVSSGLLGPGETRYLNTSGFNPSVYLLHFTSGNRNIHDIQKILIY